MARGRASGLEANTQHGTVGAAQDGARLEEGRSES